MTDAPGGRGAGPETRECHGDRPDGRCSFFQKQGGENERLSRAEAETEVLTNPAFQAAREALNALGGRRASWPRHTFACGWWRSLVCDSAASAAALREALDWIAVTVRLRGSLRTLPYMSYWDDSGYHVAPDSISEPIYEGHDFLAACQAAMRLAAIDRAADSVGGGHD